MNLRCSLHATEVGGDEGFEVRMYLSSLLDESDSVANAEAVLEEQGAADALKGTLAHDSDTVTEDIGLVHIVRGQHNDPVLLIALKHIP